MSTQDNLKAAFAGESQANRTYLAFAKKADEDGYPQIAKLFRAAAAAGWVRDLPRSHQEAIFARGGPFHLRLLWPFACPTGFWIEVSCAS